jgi:hypothetical protein
MQSAIKIKGIIRTKNKILNHLNGLKFSDVVSMSKAFNIAFEVVYYVLEEMENEGSVKLTRVTGRDAANNFLAKISNKGKAILLNGGYQESSPVIAFIKNHVVAIAVTVIATLMGALILKFFGIA